MVHVAKDVRRSSLSFPDAPKAQFPRSGRLCDAKSYEVAPSDDLVAVPKLMVAEAELILRVANVVFLWENALARVHQSFRPPETVLVTVRRALSWPSHVVEAFPYRLRRLIPVPRKAKEGGSMPEAACRNSASRTTEVLSRCSR